MSIERLISGFSRLKDEQRKVNFSWDGNRGTLDGDKHNLEMLDPLSIQALSYVPSDFVWSTDLTFPKSIQWCLAMFLIDWHHGRRLLGVPSVVLETNGEIYKKAFGYDDPRVNPEMISEQLEPNERIVVFGRYINDVFRESTTSLYLLDRRNGLPVYSDLLVPTFENVSRLRDDLKKLQLAWDYLGLIENRSAKGIAGDPVFENAVGDLFLNFQHRLGISSVSDWNPIIQQWPTSLTYAIDSLHKLIVDYWQQMNWKDKDVSVPYDLSGYFGRLTVSLYELLVSTIRQFDDSLANVRADEMRWPQMKAESGGNSSAPIGAELQETDDDVVESNSDKGQEAACEDTCIFKRNGAYIDVQFDDERGTIPFTLMGAKYVFVLLKHQSYPIEASLLRFLANGMANESTDRNQKHTEADSVKQTPFESTPKTDETQNREALRKLYDELREINDDLEGDSLSEQERAQYEKDKLKLEKEVKRLSLHGKPRQSSDGDPNQNARSAVRQCLETFYKTCREKWQLRKVAEHFSRQIKTDGTTYTYHPVSEISWEI